MKGVNLALKSYGEAFRFLASNNLMPYLIVPFLLNIAIFWGGLEVVSIFSNYTMDYISSQIREFSLDFKGLEVLQSVLSLLIWISLKVLYIILYALIGGYLVLVTMSPLLAHLSEKTESIITGKKYHFNLLKLLKEAGRGILIASRNFAIELLFTLLLVILSFVPVINLLTPFALFILTSYFYGFSFMDYSNERRKPALRDGIKFIRNNKMATIGIGGIFNLVLMVPFIGVIIGSFLSIVSVVAATIVYLKIDNQS